MTAKCCQSYAMCCRIAAYLLIVPGVVLSGLAVASCSFVTRRGGTGYVLIKERGVRG